jgi:hypothetical protein
VTNGISVGRDTRTSCDNCGAEVADRFCSSCGQRAAGRIVSLRALLREVLEDQLSLEARLPRTLHALLLRPGRLTADYREGRIARYVPPTRLYLVTGLVFFLVVSYVVSFEGLFSNIAPYIDDETGQVMEGASVVVVGLPVHPERAPAVLRPLARHYRDQQDRLNALPPREGSRIVYGGILSHVSMAVLLLVPGFALVLKALYPRRFYTEHLVFILHLHSAFFLLGILPLLVGRLWVTAPMLLLMATYLFLALRRGYGRPALATVPRFLALLLVYPLAIGVVAVSVLVVTVLTH